MGNVEELAPPAAAFFFTGQKCHQGCTSLCSSMPPVLLQAVPLVLESGGIKLGSQGHLAP